MRLLLCAAIVVLLYLLYAERAHAAVLEQARPLQVGCPGVASWVVALAILGSVFVLLLATLAYVLAAERIEAFVKARRGAVP